MAGPDAAAANMQQHHHHHQQQQRHNPILAFAHTATGCDGKLSLPHPIWLSRAATMLQTVALPFAFYFKPVVVLLALSWLCYRAYQVMNKPLEELAALLGFDIPCEPIIHLTSIKADGAIVHWSLPDKTRHKTSFKFDIHLNGTVIDTFSIHESAATIYGLQPGCFYVVRVSLVNNVEFSSRSAPIRFRTRAGTSNDFFVAPPDGNDTDADEVHVPVPRARPYKGLKDITPANADAAPMVREGSIGLGPKRSLTGGRRLSPAAIAVEKHDPPTDENEPPEGAETIHQLTEKLDQIRRETEDADRQAKEEEEEEMRQKEELNKQRDELRSEVAENDKNSRNLKKEVNTLERQNTAAQNERTKQERLLQQKKQERQKLKDDMVRWEQEAEAMRLELDTIKQKKEAKIKDAEKEKDLLRAKQAEEAAIVKALDEEIKEKSIEIKELQRVIKNTSPSDSSESEPNMVQQLQQDAEAKRLWELQHSQMQAHYAAAYQKLEQAKRFHSEQRAYLDQLRARKRQEEEAAHYASPPATQERLPHRGDSQRSRRAQSGHSSSDSPRLAGFPITSTPFSTGMTSTMSPFGSAPFLNFTNGMTVPGPTDAIEMSDEDRDRITGGAAISPGAGVEFLPADLFGDGDNKLSSDFIKPLPGLGSLPGLGPSSMNQVVPDAGPASPTSGPSSRSPSVFASPQASQQNLHIGSPENVLDSDRRSIQSTRSNRATSGSGTGTGSRFSAIFGIKQRAKTNSADAAPALGKAQSHSMPRTDQGIPGIDSNTRKRNSSMSGSDFDLEGEGSFDNTAAPPPLSMRSRAFNLFRGHDKSDGWPSSFTRRPASPRPGSTHSNELPRPSFDSTRWGVGVDGWEAAAGARSSPLALGSTTGWNAPSSQQQSRLFGSRHPSRRPSAQYGASGPPEDILEDSNSDQYDSDRAQQLGAIGTRPPPGSKKAETAPAIDLMPKLNPNAKSFTAWFGSKKGKSRESASGSGTPNLDKADRDESPPNSRKSKDTRDTRSITTAESSLAESSRNSNELARTPSYTASDAAPSPLLAGSSAGKESFMQKLSRKSSSSKFTLPTFKREKSKMDMGLTTATSARTEEEDADLSASVSSLQQPRESKEANRGSGRNWSNAFKLGSTKKRGNETPSLSGMSMTTSGTEDNDDE